MEFNGKRPAAGAGGGRRGHRETDRGLIDKELKQVKLGCDRIDMTGSSDRP